MTYFFEIYGCQMNIAEAAALRLVCGGRGWTEAARAEDADLVLLHTCSVRATAEQRVLGRLGQYAALKKKRRAGGGRFALVLSGCMAARMGGELKKEFPAIDYLMGPRERELFPRILEAEEGSFSAGNFPAGSGEAPSAEKPVFSFASSHLEEGQFRSFIPIMHGCDNFCSYCIVPYVRGREVSRSPASILEEIRLLASRGVREITLLGQNVNSYRRDGTGFPELLGLVAGELARQGGTIGWARFLSSHPKDLSLGAIEVMAANPCFCRHLHLCVQHGSNRILAAMNRRYTREDYLGLVSRLREAMPGITLSTDILVGFPGETEDDLEETLALMEQVQFLYAYMYHYNPREGTSAYKFEGRISGELKRARLARVIALQKKHTASLLKSRIGCTGTALIEGISRKNADELVGRTERDEMLVLPGPASLIGSFVTVKFSSLSGNTLRGTLV
ncbi:MAG: tRNA (N6-isopentenyl adenosine(37)-C2)-methylthiotransferase MiaB [Spirochaetaceae bacterium]|nr:tRNA (N6-isopentenyl adenosine(37)-C2)-methylthiotransferase MiaB [Spirochaetaceae bacterium]